MLPHLLLDLGDRLKQLCDWTLSFNNQILKHFPLEIFISILMAAFTAKYILILFWKFLFNSKQKVVHYLIVFLPHTPWMQTSFISQQVESKTPQGIEPRPGIQECHHRSLLLFFFAVKGLKAKPGGTASKSLFPQEKKTPPPTTWSYLLSVTSCKM